MDFDFSADAALQPPPASTADLVPAPSVGGDDPFGFFDSAPPPSTPAPAASLALADDPFGDFSAPAPVPVASDFGFGDFSSTPAQPIDSATATGVIDFFGASEAVEQSPPASEAAAVATPALSSTGVNRAYSIHSACHVDIFSAVSVRCIRATRLGIVRHLRKSAPRVTTVLACDR